MVAPKPAPASGPAAPAPAGAAIIRLEHIWKSFKSQVVLADLTLDIGRSSSTVVIGPSGCGKTVLLKHIVLLLRPDRGKVLFDGQDITNLSEGHLVPYRRRMGFLFQSSALFDSMTVGENIQFPLIESGIRAQGELDGRVAHMLRMVGLDGLQRKMPEELSGGQKKRVALARAIALEPEVLLYDEPTTGLDPIRADLINELILKLQAELHITSVVVTHDMDSARKVGDRIIMLHHGKIAADTTPDGLKDIKNDIVVRFVEGRATDEELGELKLGRAST